MDALARVVAHWSARNPDLLSRLAKAHAIARETGAVRWDGRHLVHRVRSQANPAGVYRVALVHRSCTCPDQPSAPRGWCKHLLAVALLGAAASLVGGELVADPSARRWRELVTRSAAAPLAVAS